MIQQKFSRLYRCVKMNKMLFFYEKIAKVYLVWKQINFIQLNYRPRGGGGSAIAPQYARIQEERHRAGQYSIRITKQWRICFIWQNENAYNVEILDYH